MDMPCQSRTVDTWAILEITYGLEITSTYTPRNRSFPTRGVISMWSVADEDKIISVVMMEGFMTSTSPQTVYTLILRSMAQVISRIDRVLMDAVMTMVIGRVIIMLSNKVI